VIFVCSSCGSPDSQALSDWNRLCSSGAGLHVYRVIEDVDGIVHKRHDKAFNLDTGMTESEGDYYPLPPDFVSDERIPWDHVTGSGYRYKEFEVTTGMIQSFQNRALLDRRLSVSRDPAVPGFYRAEIGARTWKECDRIERDQGAAYWRLDWNECIIIKGIEKETAEYQVTEGRTVYTRSHAYGSPSTTDVVTYEAAISDRFTGEILATYKMHQIAWPMATLRKFPIPKIQSADTGSKRCPADDFNINSVLKKK
jgi:hypothetical protein